jgi:hypothetical protein
VDVRVTVAGQTSAVTAGDAYAYTATATATTLPVAVPALGRGYGYWVAVMSAAAGPIEATWSTPARVQGTLAIYAGNPFAGSSDPVKGSPPSGAIATSSGRSSAFSATTASVAAGVYTAYFYAGANVAASSGSVTYMR